ncbi:MAG: hypothetical protein WCL26_01255 [Actinomycetes bacterium]|jgi:hypothetical protein
MFKAIRRLFGLFAVLAVIFGALKSVFEWLDRNGEDDHEIFAEEEHSL